MSGDRILGFSPLWARRVLAASLVVNFLVIGAVAGLGLRSGDHGQRGGSLYRQIEMAVAEERRGEVRSIISEGRAAWLESRAERSRVWIEVADALDRDPFDEPALRAVFAKEIETRADHRRRSRDALVRVFSVMTAEERSGFAGEIREHVKRRAEREKKWRRPEE